MFNRGGYMKSHVFGCALLSAVAIVASAPAQAQNGTLTRSFVASAGVDTNPCTITEPCATFAEAYTKIGANGIVAALDPGKYGPLTITSPVTINGNGWAAITGPAGSNAITINATSGSVVLTGLEIDGAGAAYNGIQFNSGGSLTVNNCIIQSSIQDGSSDQTTGNGILIAPTSAPPGGVIAFYITNTTVAGNAYGGIFYRPPSGSFTAIGVIDHVSAHGNQFGVDVYTVLATGSFSSISISNSILSSNFQDGIVVSNAGSSASISLGIDNSNVGNNLYGLYATGTPYVVLGRSSFTQNEFYGVYNNTSSSTVFSFGNNDLDFNGPLGGNGNATLNPLTTLSQQ
jgi:hypothetical protein